MEPLEDDSDDSPMILRWLSDDSLFSGGLKHLSGVYDHMMKHTLVVKTSMPSII